MQRGARRILHAMRRPYSLMHIAAFDQKFNGIADFPITRMIWTEHYVSLIDVLHEADVIRWMPIVRVDYRVEWNGIDQTIYWIDDGRRILFRWSLFDG